MSIITYYDLAKLIPSPIREMVLLENMIYKAVANERDQDMIKLFIIYKNYIEPENAQYQYADGKIINVCQLCLTNILDKFKLLEPYLISLQKEDKLIEG